MINTSFEKELIKTGKTNIVGIDEAGRGPLAGPMVVASVILDTKYILELYDIQSRNNDIVANSPLKEYLMIKDSKKLSVKKRETLEEFIKDNAIEYNIQVIEHKLIDKKGIATATQVGFYNAVAELKSSVEHILTDNFEIKGLKKYIQTNIPKGDNLSVTIAAASILAKTHRDKIMCEYHRKFPNYGFNKHKGYGTKFHIEMLQEHGPCDIHRKTFEPIKSMTL